HLAAVGELVAVAVGEAGVAGAVALELRARRHGDVVRRAGDAAAAAIAGARRGAHLAAVVRVVVAVGGAGGALHRARPLVQAGRDRDLAGRAVARHRVHRRGVLVVPGGAA